MRFDVIYTSPITAHIAQRGKPGYDRLGKIRPVIDAVNKAFLEAYNPHCENSIDEAMIKFMGRSTIKQYLPLKPIKRGIKAWVRADTRNGMMCEVNVYTGKDGDQPEKNLDANDVKKLTSNTVGGNHHIYCDNYFTSTHLLDDLFKDDIIKNYMVVGPTEEIEKVYQRISRLLVSCTQHPHIRMHTRNASFVNRQYHFWLSRWSRARARLCILCAWGQRVVRNSCLLSNIHPRKAVISQTMGNHIFDSHAYTCMS